MQNIARARNLADFPRHHYFKKISLVVKMFRLAFLLLAFSFNVFHCSPTPDFPHTENRNLPIGDGVRDLFKNMRGKMLIKDSMNSGAGVMGMGLDLNSNPLKSGMANDMVERMMKMMRPGSISIDLSNVKFDPSKDWGFRLGNWYLIRKFEPGEESSRKNLEEWINWDDLISDDDMTLWGISTRKPVEVNSYATSHSSTSLEIATKEMVTSTIKEIDTETNERNDIANDNVIVANTSTQVTTSE
ncbi:uncharacterized protein LOC106659607 isoform X2 [Trichogramma pretiosum]|uniref:uncharacterized protein LOC106659607 isoform X2 n=1 Tax=Trichogramma pretiosum TaxID=7493 RepID=UPI0006C99BAE|nr:uncharacterized protein LOC106659607 isoform X2 [Trichogramma pretiosum]